MGTSVDLQAQIKETERQIQRDYGKTLDKMRKLKNQMNKLERQTPKAASLKALNLATKRLNRLTDSQITRSREAWEEYRKLEQECGKCGQCSVQLDNLKAMCKKTEELAADLLCYSLARFRKNEL